MSDTLPTCPCGFWISVCSLSLSGVDFCLGAPGYPWSVLDFFLCSCLYSEVDFCPDSCAGLGSYPCCDLSSPCCNHNYVTLLNYDPSCNLWLEIADDPALHHAQVMQQLFPQPHLLCVNGRNVQPHQMTLLHLECDEPPWLAVAVATRVSAGVPRRLLAESAHSVSSRASAGWGQVYGGTAMRTTPIWWGMREAFHQLSSPDHLLLSHPFPAIETNEISRSVQYGTHSSNLVRQILMYSSVYQERHTE